MTLREKMKKPILRVGFYVMVIGVGGGAGLAHYPLGLMVLILVSWGVLSIAISLAMRWLARCPNCRTRMRANGYAITKERPTIDNCPHCGVNFDQSIETLANPQ